MKIAHRTDDESGPEMKLVTVEKDGRQCAYFQELGTDKANLQAPHFVATLGVTYGSLESLIYDLNNMFEKFVCPDFADREELKRLRAENAELRRSPAAAQELEGLRAELELFRAEERERAELNGRLAVLDTPHDKRSETV